MSCRPPEINLCEGEISVFRAPLKISTYDWCRKNLRLVAGPFKDQLWRSDMTPHAKGIMDAFDLPKVEEVFILGPSQTTNKTTIAQGCVLSSLAEKIKPVGVGVTTEKQLKRIMDDRLRKYIEAIPALKRRLRADRFAVQKDEITFDDDSKIYGMWSGSDASYSSASMEIVHLSEVDAYQDWASVFKMLERLDAYRMLGTAKALLESKVRGCVGKPSIYTLARDRAQMWCNIEARCPACGTYQVMTLKRISALDEDGKLVTDPKRIMKERLGRYQCKCCDYRWNDAVKNAALRAGRWLGDLSGVSSVAFHIRSWETIGCSLSTVLHDWYAAQGKPDELENFHNNHCTQLYQNTVRTTSEEGIRAMIRDDFSEQTGEVLYPARFAPPETLAVTCGIDNQKRDRRFVVIAWDRQLCGTIIDYGIIPSWDGLADFLRNTAYPVTGKPGYVAPIWRALLDIGGGEGEHEATMTDEALSFLQSNPDLPVWGCKGSSRAMDVPLRLTTWGKDPEAKAKYQLFSGQLRGYLLETSRLKGRLHALLSRDHQNPLWLNAEAGDDLIAQLGSEEKIRDARGRYKWIKKKGVENHYLDCAVYALACADAMMLPPLQQLHKPIIQMELVDEVYQMQKPKRKPRPQGRNLW